LSNKAVHANETKDTADFMGKRPLEFTEATVLLIPWRKFYVLRAR